MSATTISGGGAYGERLQGRSRYGVISRHNYV